MSAKPNIFDAIPYLFNIPPKSKLLAQILDQHNFTPPVDEPVQKPLRAPKPPKPISMAPEVYTEIRASLEQQQQALRDKIQARRSEIKRLAKEQAHQKRLLGALGDLVYAMTPHTPKPEAKCACYVPKDKP